MPGRSYSSPTSVGFDAVRSKSLLPARFACSSAALKRFGLRFHSVRRANIVSNFNTSTSLWVANCPATQASHLGMNSRFAALGLLALLALCGQANAGDEFSKQDLSDEMPTVVSLAAETELFTDFVASGQSRTHFTREHAAYLLDSVKDELKKLQKKSPSQA